MTDPQTPPAPLDPFDELDPDNFANEFFTNRMKLWMATVAQGGIAAFVLWKWIETDSAEPLVPVLCIVLLIFAFLFWREAKDTRPILTVTDEGLLDRRHGFIPWSNIAYYQYKKSFFSPVFGYTLVAGATPPEGGLVYKLQGLMNRMSGRPTRVWQKHMVVGGLEPMLLAARLRRPDLERLK